MKPAHEKPGEKYSELSWLFFNQVWMHETNRLKISDYNKTWHGYTSRAHDQEPLSPLLTDRQTDSLFSKI